MPDAAFNRFGKYEIQAELGRGGFGRVFRAFDPTVGRLVAIKILVSEAGADLFTRFRNEAIAAGNLRHENIVTIYEFGEEKGVPFLAMEYLEGEDLQQAIASGKPLTLLDKVSIMRQTAAGLECAHRNGVVHRDVKPANIRLMPDGVVKLMDFGIARLIRDAGGARLTRQGHVLGTLLYMAPEQVMGSDTDALSDIFAFGVTFYELLTGRHPFQAEDPRSVFYKITSEDPELIHHFVPACPEALDTIIRRALHKDRELRYQTLHDLRVDVEPVLIDLRKERAATLVVEAHRLVDEGNFEVSRPLLNEAIDLDPANSAARQLRDTVQGELRRRLLRPRIEALLAKADQSVTEGNYADAVQTLENALRLDPEDMALQARSREAQQQRDQSRESNRLLSEARADLAQGSMETALRKASEAVALSPTSADARSLLEIIQLGVHKREWQRQLDEKLRQARQLLLLSSVDEALVLMNALEQDERDAPEAKELLAQIEAQKTECERQERLQADLTAANELLRHAQFVDAVQLLQRLRSEFPGEIRVDGLLSHAQQELASFERAEAIEKLHSEVLACAEAKQFDQAFELLASGMSEYPEETSILGLRDTVFLARSEWEHQEAVEKTVRKCEVLADQSKFEEALAALHETFQKYPGDSLLDEVRRRLETGREQFRKTEAVLKAVETANLLMKDGQPGEAVAALKGAEAEYGESPELTNALDRARDAVTAQRRNESLMAAVQECERLCAEEKYQEASDAAEAALRDHPEAPALLAVRLAAVEGGKAALARAEAAAAEVERAKAKAAQSQLAVQRCEELLESGDLIEAGRTLQNALRDFPGEPELEAIQQRLRAQWERQRRSEAIRRAADNARALLDRGQVARALQLLEAAAAQYADEPVLQDALARVREAQGEQKKAEVVELVCRETRVHLDKNDFEQALRAVEMKLEMLSDEPRLVQLRATVIAAQQDFARTAEGATAASQAVTDEMPIVSPTHEAGMAQSGSHFPPSEAMSRALEGAKIAPRARLLEYRTIAFVAAGCTLALAAMLLGTRVLRHGVATTALTVESEPQGAAVTIGERSCITPKCRLELPAGNHRIDARLPGYAATSRVVSIRKGEAADVQVILEPLPTSLAITSNFTTGNVYLNAKPVGQLRDGQFALNELQSGLHHLRISSAEGEASLSFRSETARLPELHRDIKAGDADAIVITSLGDSVRAACARCEGALMMDGKPFAGTAIKSGDHELTARTIAGYTQRVLFRTSEAPSVAVHLSSAASSAGTLVIETNVDGASVSIDRRRLGRQTEGGRLVIPLEPRDYRIEIQKQGYRSSPERLVAQIRKGDQFRAAFRLDPIPGSIVLSGMPESATVLIDGSPVGTVRGGGFSTTVSPGPHTVGLAKEGFKTASTHRSFGPGETVRLDSAVLRLEPLPQAPKQPPPQPSQQPPLLSAEEIEAREWTAARSARDRVAIQTFLQKRPKTLHRQEAEQMLAQLEWEVVDHKDRSALERFAAQHRGNPLAEQAAAEIARMEREATAAAAKTAEDRGAVERAEISKVLTTYSAAFERKDLTLLKTVWPTLPEAALAQVFRGGGAIRSQLRLLGPVELSGDRATARCMRITEQVTQFGRQKPVEETRTVRLRRESGRWVIYAID